MRIESARGPWKTRAALLAMILAAALGGTGRATLGASEVQAALASAAESLAPVTEGSQPEWWQTLPPVQPGFPVTLSGAYLASGSSPTLVDLDGDGRLEVLVAGRDLQGGAPGTGGVVYAYRHNGSVFWQTHVRAPVNSSPSAADLNNDDHPDVVVSMGGYPVVGPWHGGVIALNGLTGEVLWTFDTQDWLYHDPDGWRDGVFSTPAIGDVDGDGQPEIAFGAWDQCAYLLDRNGQPLWGNIPGRVPGIFCGGHGYYNEDTFWSSPALADLTGDGLPEIIIGADISPGNSWGDPAGGYLYVFDANGATLAQKWMDQAIASSPAAADLDNDGQMEVVVGTGDVWPNTGHYVSAFDFDLTPLPPRDRLVLKWRAPTAGKVFASPAIGDLNQDGWLDVVVTAPVNGAPDGRSVVYGWRGRDGQSLFERTACDYLGNSASASSPIIADLDDDPFPEIPFSHAWEVAILNHDGTYYSDFSNPRCAWCIPDPGCGRDHTPTTELTYWARWSLYATPSAGDLDGDGDVELVIGGHNPENPDQGMLFAWTGHPKKESALWPTWRHDEAHTGSNSLDLAPPINPDRLFSTSHIPGVWSTDDTVEVAWSGAVDWGSGVAGYSVAWDSSATTLPDDVLDLGPDVEAAASPPLSPSDSWHFHIRTADSAGNWADSALHLGPFFLARYLVQGRIRNVREQAVGGAVVTADPPVMNQAVSQTSGAYTLALSSLGTHELVASHPGFGSLPPMLDVAIDGDMTDVDFVLPPEPDLIIDGDFEIGSGWEAAGPALPAPVSGSGHTGVFAMNMGALPGGSEEGLQTPGRSRAFSDSERDSSGGPISSQLPAVTSAIEPWTWSISQTVTLPDDLPRATLSWLYRVEGEPVTGDRFVVSVRGAGHIETREVTPDNTAWTHDWLSVASLYGEEVVVELKLVRPVPTESLTLLIDEVSLGSAPPPHLFLPLVQASP